jgi:hypothetical protein
MIRAIAELDLKHERGEIDTDTWTSERARLKERVRG